jgi:hypothetical protein
LHKTSIRCIKNSCLNKLYEFLKIVGRITTYNFIQINIITTKYAYYMIVQLKLSYEYSTTLIFQKNISKMHWKLLFKQVVYGFQHFLHQNYT